MKLSILSCIYLVMAVYFQPIRGRGNQEGAAENEYKTPENSYPVKSNDDYKAPLPGYQNNDSYNQTGLPPGGYQVQLTQTDIPASPTDSYEQNSGNPSGESGNTSGNNSLSLQITIKATFNNQSYSLSIGPVTPDIAAGKIPTCGDKDGVTAPASATDVVGTFCYALRQQMSTLPNCEGVKTGGAVSAERVQQQNAPDPAKSSGDLSSQSGSLRSIGSSSQGVILFTCVASTIFSFTL